MAFDFTGRNTFSIEKAFTVIGGGYTLQDSLMQKGGGKTPKTDLFNNCVVPIGLSKFSNSNIATCVSTYEENTGDVIPEDLYNKLLNLVDVNYKEEEQEEEKQKEEEKQEEDKDKEKIKKSRKTTKSKPKNKTKKNN
jgi:hypothetical protein